MGQYTWAEIDPATHQFKSTQLRTWLQSLFAAKSDLDAVIPRQTPLQSITANLINGWTADDVTLQRVGNLVVLTVSNLSTTGTVGEFYVPPAGFGLPNVSFARPGMVVTTSGTARLVSGQRANNRGLYLASFTAAAGYHGTAIWVTPDAWPATLPGTAI